MCSCLVEEYMSCLINTAVYIVKTLVCIVDVLECKLMLKRVVKTRQNTYNGSLQSLNRFLT